jgi:hypothetical protein
MGSLRLSAGMDFNLAPGNTELKDSNELTGLIERLLLLMVVQ